MIPLKKLCVIFTIITMSLINSSLAASQGIDTSNMYFYGNMSYEGFAGYLTVITPEISEASKSMKRKLNINDVKNIQSVQTTAYSNKNKQNYKASTNKVSISKNQFSAITTAQATKIKAPRQKTLLNEFEDIVISL